MRVKVLKTSETVYDGNASKLTVPTENGQITILPHHVAIMTALAEGKVSVDGTDLCDITSGMCRFSDGMAVVIVM